MMNKASFNKLNKYLLYLVVGLTPLLFYLYSKTFWIPQTFFSVDSSGFKLDGLADKTESEGRGKIERY